MSNKLRERKNYSMEFKLRMLKEYYESGSTKYRLCKKYSVDYVTFSRWEGYFESKTLSLPSDLTELEHQVYMARKKSESSKRPVPKRRARGSGRRTCAYARRWPTQSCAMRLCMSFLRSVGNNMASTC